MKTVMTACLALGMLAGAMPAQTPAAPAFTKATLPEMDCMGCAKKVAKVVQAVPGVAEMRVDLKSRTVYVIHKAGAAPSPRALWEAMETADHTPSRMDTPSGSHTTKPAS